MIEKIDTRFNRTMHKNIIIEKLNEVIDEINKLLKEKKQ